MTFKESNEEILREEAEQAGLNIEEWQKLKVRIYSILQEIKKRLVPHGFEFRDEKFQPWFRKLYVGLFREGRRIFYLHIGQERILVFCDEYFTGFNPHVCTTVDEMVKLVSEHELPPEKCREKLVHPWP